MKNLLLTTSKGKVEARTMQKLASRAGFRVEALPSESLDQITTVPDLTIIDVDEFQIGNLARVVRGVANIQSQAPTRARVFFSIKTSPKHKKCQEDSAGGGFVAELNKQLKVFPNPELVDVIFEKSASSTAAWLNYMSHKIDLAHETAGASARAIPRPSPLDVVEEVIEATEDLRTGDKGNLSADSVAKAFGVSMNQLAGWLKRSRQAVSKTPDADSLQNKLSFFERVARLRAVVNREGFLKWLRMPNRELDEKQPLELLAGGEGQVVADLVDDMLTGAPA